MVRHDPVYAEVQETDHLAWIVDSPYVDLKATVVGQPEPFGLPACSVDALRRHLAHAKSLRGGGR